MSCEAAMAWLAAAAMAERVALNPNFILKSAADLGCAVRDDAADRHVAAMMDFV